MSQDTTSQDESITRGLAFVKKVYGSLAKNASTVPDEIRDDMYAWSLKSVSGDIWSRPGLDLRSRLMITVAVLAVLNRREGLREHVIASLNNGVSRQEVCEVLFHIAFLSGLPSAVESLRLAKTVFDEFDAKANIG